MKKMFSIVLSMVFMVTCFSTQVYATSGVDKAPDETLVSTLDGEDPQDVIIGLGLLTQMDSWDEVQDLLDFFKGVDVSNEDQVTMIFMDTLNEPNTISVYHDEPYIKMSYGGTTLDSINLERLKNKFDVLCSIYNNSQDELTVEYTIQNYSENILSMDIYSTNLEYLDNPATKIGQKVYLKPDTYYYESAKNDGSGKYGIANSGNQYIPEDMMVYVNGVAYLDDSRTNIIESEYIPYENLADSNISIEPHERRMVHICTPNVDLGWVYAECVHTLEK